MMLVSLGLSFKSSRAELECLTTKYIWLSFMEDPGPNSWTSYQKHAFNLIKNDEENETSCFSRRD